MVVTAAGSLIFLLEVINISHRMEGKASLTVENKDLVEEAIQEAYSDCQILKNEIAQIRGRPKCDYVIRRPRNHDIGLIAQEDGTYKIVSYNPGYGGDQLRVNQMISPVYTKYAEKVVKQSLKKMGISAKIDDAVDSTYVINGKETKTKKVKVTILGGVKSGKKSKGSTSGGYI